MSSSPKKLEEERLHLQQARPNFVEIRDHMRHHQKCQVPLLLAHEMQFLWGTSYETSRSRHCNIFWVGDDVICLEKLTICLQSGQRGSRKGYCVRKATLELQSWSQNC
jgi:hypothetical protein